VIDEAYIEFADQRESMTSDITKYQHACLLRTFSKAFGLASIRLGYLIAHQEITQWIHRVRSPYHVNQMSQVIGCLALERTSDMMNKVQQLINERERVYQILVNLGLPVEPSKGNFVYIKSSSLRLSDELKKRGIVIREWSDGSSRITIGLPEENNMLIQAIKEIIA
jgi:histidinol-phosphate aminotransferase